MAESTSSEKKSAENTSSTKDFLNSDESTGLLASGVTDQPSVSTLPKSIDQQQQRQPPPSGQMSQSTKPILTRQDPIINLVSPQLSITTLGRSSEANSEDSQSGLRTKLARDSQNESQNETPIISLSFEKYDEPATGSATNYFNNKDPPYNKNVCRLCRTNEKDAFINNTTTKLIKKTNSKDNVSNPGRFTLYLTKHYSSYSPSSAVHTSSPLMGSRVIRQSSQPEESSANYCVSNCPHVFVTPNHSLRQSKDGNEGIADIAADSLRVNGVMAMKPFRQVSVVVDYNF